MVLRMAKEVHDLAVRSAQKKYKRTTEQEQSKRDRAAII